MTQYMLSVIHPEEGPEFPDDVDIQEVFTKVDTFNKELMDNGNWVFGGGLEPPSSATVVDASGKDVLVTDGPYARPRSNSAASGSSRRPTWTRPWTWASGRPQPAWAPWRSAPSRPSERPDGAGRRGSRSGS